MGDGGTRYVSVGLGRSQSVTVDPGRSGGCRWVPVVAGSPAGSRWIKMGTAGLWWFPVVSSWIRHIPVGPGGSRWMWVGAAMSSEFTPPPGEDLAYFHEASLNLSPLKIFDFWHRFGGVQ